MDKAIVDETQDKGQNQGTVTIAENIKANTVKIDAQTKTTPEVKKEPEKTEVKTEIATDVNLDYEQEQKDKAINKHKLSSSARVQQAVNEKNEAVKEKNAALETVTAVMDRLKAIEKKLETGVISTAQAGKETAQVEAETDEWPVEFGPYVEVIEKKINDIAEKRIADVVKPFKEREQQLINEERIQKTIKSVGTVSEQYPHLFYVNEDGEKDLKPEYHDVFDELAKPFIDKSGVNTLINSERPEGLQLLIAAVNDRVKKADGIKNKAATTEQAKKSRIESPDSRKSSEPPDRSVRASVRKYMKEIT